MGTGELMNLTWNKFQDTTVETFRNLGRTREFADITLAWGDGEQGEAHRVILSSCSPVLRRILLLHPHQHTLLYMRGMALADLNNLVKFMYFGEVMVETDSLEHFLECASELKVVGLSRDTSEEETPTDEPFKEKERQAPDTSNATKEGNNTEIHELSVKIENGNDDKEDSNFCQYETCLKKFSTKANLKAHIKSTHEDIKYDCILCSFSSGHKSNLTKHIKKMHKAMTDDNPSLETELSIETESVKTVVESNEKEEPGESELSIVETESDQTYLQDEHECDQCGTTNKSGKALMKHRNEKHPGLNWFCSTCGKEFASHSNLKIHKKSIHQLVRFSCDMCELQFKWKGGLNHHTKTKHTV